MIRNARKPQQGATMVEVMVAILVFSVGLLGIASTQTRGLSNTQSALHRSYAAQLSYELIDIMRVNRLTVDLGDAVDGNIFNGFDTEVANAFVSKTDCLDASKSCTASEMAQFMLLYWVSRLDETLPEAEAEITEVDAATALYSVEIQWADFRSDRWRDGEGKVSFTTRFRL
jgi:type IV pilus assembly protein PilV